MPFGPEELPTSTNMRNWRHLSSITKYIPEFDSNIPFGLLIGGNCVKALEPCEIVTSQDGGPYAVRIRLGWCATGRIDADKAAEIKCNFINTRLATKDTETNRIEYRHQVIHNTIKETTIGKFLENM